MPYSHLLKLFNEISEVSELLCERGWAEKNAGNLSVDVTDILPQSRKRKSKGIIGLEREFESLADRLFLITPSGSRFRDIAKDAAKHLILIRMDECGGGCFILNESHSYKPTSELKTHLKIHNYLRETNSDFRVVLHTHPTELITISHISEFQTTERLSSVLISAHPEVFINLRDNIGFVRYLLTGSDSLADATLDCIKMGKRVVLWERHGALAIEKNVITAFDHLDIANKAAEITLKLYMLGNRPKRLNKREIEELKSLF